jgi:hypothetical protein
MGKGTRTRNGRATKVAARALSAALREQDQECADIAQGVYDASRRMRETARVSGASLWVLGATTFIAEQSAVRLAAGQEWDERVAGLAAAYVQQGLMESLKALVVDFDPEHFEEWCRAFAAEATAG